MKKSIAVFLAGLIALSAFGQTFKVQNLQVLGNATIATPLAITYGGTGASTQGAALTAILGSSTVPITNGGTGASTQPTALTAILGSSTVPIANGGTGASTQPAALTAILGSSTVPIANGGTGAATQPAALTAILGSSTVPIANGGTGASTQPAALTAILGSSTIPIANGGTNSATATGATSNLQYLQGATGSVARTLTNKFQDTVNVKDFGAACDGTTNDTTAFANAEAALGSLGGTVRYNGRCRIQTNLTVPFAVVLEGPSKFVAIPDGHFPAEATTRSALLLDSTATITLADNAGISNSFIYRFGMAWPAVDASLFAGTAITVNGSDTFISGSAIAGFNLAYISSPASGNFNRNKLTDVYLDNQSGLSITNSGDVTRIDNVHAWPFSTQYNAAPAAAQHRTGTAYYITGVQDYTKFTDTFSFGYNIGFRFASANNVDCLGCGADGDSAYSGSIGYLIDGTSVSNNLIGSRASGQDTGVYFNSTSTTTPNFVTGSSIWGNTTRNILVNQSDVNIVGGMNFSSVDGIDIALASSIVSVEGVGFSALTTGVKGIVPTTNTYVGPANTFSAVTNNLVNVQVPNGSFFGLTHFAQEIDKSYTFNTPTTGQTVTLAGGTETALIVPAGTLASLTITLPGCTSGYDGSLARFSSSQAVTVLTVNATSGTVVDAPTSLALGSGNGYLCRGANTSWYRLY